MKDHGGLTEEVPMAGEREIERLQEAGWAWQGGRPKMSRLMK